jgi:hypothetical protein
MSHTIAEIVCPIECVKAGCETPPDFLEKHSTFLITLLGSFGACLGVVFTYFLKSRCKKISTPCFTCDRDVIEIKQENIEINNIE